MKIIINFLVKIYKTIDAKVLIILILAFFIWNKHNTNNNKQQQQIQYVDTVIIYTDTLLDVPQQQEKQLDTINLFKKYLWKKIKQVI